jgi:hypothetical protein
MKMFTAILATVLLSVACNPSKPNTEVYFVPDVVAQFNALPERAEALGFWIGSSPDPLICKHYQGLARRHGKGTPYFFITKSGNKTSSCALEDDDPGNLLVVRMESRNQTGERMRSNRLLKGVEVQDTPPLPLPWFDKADTVVHWVWFDGNDTDALGQTWPAYYHPGGLQLVGDVLAVSLEKPYDGDPANLILFVDVSSPEEPVILSRYDVGVRADFNAGLVGLAPMPSGRYLMLVTGDRNKVLRFYESLPTDGTETGPTDLKDPALSWELCDEWTEAEDEEDLFECPFPSYPSVCFSVDWPTGIAPSGGSHQSLNFVREGFANGALYLLGAINKGGGGGGAGYDEDELDLYRVEISGASCSEYEVHLRFASTKSITAKPTLQESHGTGGPDIANFAAASGTYVSPSGELLVYATEHDNDGPWATVRAGEWRHKHMARSGSPTFDPTAIIDQQLQTSGGSTLTSPFRVDEGESMFLTGHGDAPITKAWIELFADPDWTDRSLVVDYEDWDLEDLGDFKDLDGDDVHPPGFSDQASSWRYFAPVGCTIRVNDDDFWDSNFPGKHTKTLPGEDEARTASNLKNVRNDRNDGDMDDELTSMQFFEDCDDYYDGYGAGYSTNWSLFSAPPSASELIESELFAVDGPSEAWITMVATRLFDGRSGSDTAYIKIDNVPPTIESLTVYDELRQELGSDIPVGLLGLRLTAEGTFGDRGVQDTHAMPAGSTIIDWNDGTELPSAEFDLFLDSLDGVIGEFVGGHAYLTPGIHSIAVLIEDKDLDSGQAAVQIRIVDAAAAIEIAIGILDAAGLGANPGIAKLMGDGRGHLPNGALPLLADGYLSEALEKIQEALHALEVAQVGVTNAMNLLVLAAKSVAVLAVRQAEGLAWSPADLFGIQKANYHIAYASALMQINPPYREEAVMQLEYAVLALGGIL